MRQMSKLVVAGMVVVWSATGLGQASRAPGTPPAAPTRPTPALDADFRIGPEDVLAIVVLGHPDYTRTVPVRPDGKISLPVANDVEAAGLTVAEVRTALTKVFQRFIKDPEVSVIVTEVHSVKVSVLGQVRTPVRFVLRSRATLLDALAMAGGFTEFAKRDRIQVVRADGTSLTFNYDRFLDRDRPGVTDNILLRAGDIIIVP